jgi:type IV pilus assembly protein PilV
MHKPGATPAASTGARAARGFMLIEVMISVIIFSVGVLALVGLQASMTRAQTESKVRADAAYLAQELIGLMWTDIANAASYADAGCAGYPRCAAWQAKVAALLPGGTAAVGWNAATRDVTITLSWQLPGGDPHRYQTWTNVQGAL